MTVDEVLLLLLLVLLLVVVVVPVLLVLTVGGWRWRVGVGRHGEHVREGVVVPQGQRGQLLDAARRK